MSPLAEGNQINGDYRLERRLVTGGTGALWVAFDRRLHRRVAIKFVHTGMTDFEEVCACLSREARLAAQVCSPHVAQTYDYRVYCGRPFIVMELLTGESLRARLEREERLPLAGALKVFSQVLRGLDEVHRAGIVHSDLKPANIFLARIAERDVVKICDFGAARARGLDHGDQKRRTGRTLSALRYMSPEHLRGARSVDVRSDLWSVAAIMYRALTGVHAFPGRDAAEILQRIGRAPVRSASELVAGVPPRLDALLSRAMEHDPARRFQSAPDMLAALTAITGSPLALRTRPGATRPSILDAAPSILDAPVSDRSEATPPDATHRPFPLVIRRPGLGSRPAAAGRLAETLDDPSDLERTVAAPVKRALPWRWVCMILAAVLGVLAVWQAPGEPADVARDLLSLLSQASSALHWDPAGPDDLP